MNHLNQIVIEGTVNGDVVVSETRGADCIAKFSIATTRFYKNAEGKVSESVSYFDVEAHGKSFACKCEKEAKNSSVRIVGRLQQERWEDEQGNARARVYILAECIDFYKR